MRKYYEKMLILMIRILSLIVSSSEKKPDSDLSGNGSELKTYFTETLILFTTRIKLDLQHCL
jgi:hypothetical protein